MRSKYLLFYLFIALLTFGLSSSEGANFLFREGYIKLLPYASAEKKLKKPISKEEQVQERVRNYLTKNKINGSIVIVKKNKKVFDEGIGYAEIALGTPSQPSTTYPIGSITKTIVAVCILQLQEQGKLSIQDPVTKYIHNFSNGDSIKIVHLLNHTSGIQPAAWHEGDKEPRDLIIKASKNGSKFKAGSQWDYNDINYTILGYIIEKVTGSSLHTYIANHIFKTAGMEHAGFITPDKRPSFSSQGYIKITDQTVQASQLNPYVLFGCGDIYATAFDVARFDEALLNGRLLTDKSLQEMITPGSKSGYGLGLYISGNKVYSRGVLGGWESFHIYYRDKTSIVILENIRDKGRNIKKTAEDLYSLVKEDL